MEGTAVMVVGVSDFARGAGAAAAGGGGAATTGGAGDGATAGAATTAEGGGAGEGSAGFGSGVPSGSGARAARIDGPLRPGFGQLGDGRLDDERAGLDRGVGVGLEEVIELPVAQGDEHRLVLLLHHLA